jgi:enoyl-CoA hydratase/carnithine racemase
VVGFPYAKELLFTGDSIDAERANEMGLLNHMTTKEELEPTTYEIASTIAGNAPLSLKYMKRIFRGLEDKTTPTELEQDWVKKARQETFESKDHQEGIQAFNSGEDPDFIGE